LYQLNSPCIFILFFGSVRFRSAQLTSSHPFFLSSATPPSGDVATPPLRVTLLYHGAKMSSLSLLHLLTTFHPVASPQTEIKALNPHYHRRSTFSDRPTPTLATLIITQLRLHFTSSLSKTPCHQSSTRRRRSFSPPSNIHRSFTQ
jgi:hypothetical protein